MVGVVLVPVDRERQNDALAGLIQSPARSGSGTSAARMPGWRHQLWRGGKLFACINLSD